MVTLKVPEDIDSKFYELELSVANPSNAMALLSKELERLVYENLRNSLNERDRKATVNVVKDTPTSLEVIVVRPPAEKQGKISKKELMPGRYFEIHGPGGRVKVTTSVEVMQKAKKQGVHVQMKYKMPNGKTPTTFGIYSTERIDKELSKSKLINDESHEYKEVLLKVDRLMQQQMEDIFGRAS